MQWICLSADKTQEIGSEPARLAELLERKTAVIWLRLRETDLPEELNKLLTETFHFHPLAIDDALNETHIPKLDDWGEYLYLVLQASAYQPQNHTINLAEVDMFLGQNYLITYHTEGITAVDRTWQACQRDPRWFRRGPDHILYRLIDEIINDAMNALDAVEDDLEALEVEIFTRPQARTLQALFDLKQAVLQLRRGLAPQREVVNKLARDDFSQIDPKDRVFFRDLYDHMLRLYDLSENLRDLVSGALETYLSVINNRMNDIMKTLTLITTLFMPLSFLTGFFGMNFFQPVIDLHLWTGGVAFFLTLMGMILIPVTMFWWMRYRAWM